MNEYLEQAKNFLNKAHAKCKIVYGGISRNENWEEKTKRNWYDVTITTPRGTMTYVFWNSIYNAEAMPNEYDVLACLGKYDVGTFEDFCSEFGYDEESRMAERIYIAVIKEYKDLTRIFTEDQMEELSKIQ